MENITQELLKHTAENSHFQPKRTYISLSAISMDESEIIDKYTKGDTDTLEGRLKCYKGYQMEKDILKRLQLVYCDRIKTDPEIKLYDGLFQGHPDFTFDGFPGDCKSVLMDEWLPKDNKLPRKAYWQIQAYMLYMEKDKGLIIFESRESGKLLHQWIMPNKRIQTEIHNKIENIQQQL